MFNFIASALMVYLLVNVLIAPGSMTPQSRGFAPSAMPAMHDALAAIGITWRHRRSTSRSSWRVAVLRRRLGVPLAHAVGLRAAHHGPQSRGRGLCRHQPHAHDHARHVLSGALAGFVGVNEIMGVQQRIVLDFPAGYGFVGIAVALMGRSHPVGIVLAALLFGALQQGGAELAFEIPTITRDMVVVIQGLVILFSRRAGASAAALAAGRCCARRALRDGRRACPSSSSRSPRRCAWRCR